MSAEDRARGPALWVVTARGLALARRLADTWPQAEIFAKAGLLASEGSQPAGAQPFEQLAPRVAEHFRRYRGHIFFMASGIVVRTIAPLIGHKTSDPAVVVVDDQGHHAISLLAGHIGGANALTAEVAQILGARPVITTATDLAGLPAVDRLAVARGLAIENPAAIRHVSGALLAGERVGIHDPHGLLTPELAPELLRPLFEQAADPAQEATARPPGIYVDERCRHLPDGVLMLRPRSLMAGIGCNRGTSANEIVLFLKDSFERFNLSLMSLALIASVDLKQDEPGLLAAARELERPLRFFSREQLAAVSAVPTPSDIVARHIGVHSVCEAAALLAAQSQHLLVPKQKRGNTTLAIARQLCRSSA